MKKLLIILGLMTLMTLTAVSATCTEYEIDQFRYCYGATIFTEQWDYFNCWQYDYNTNDGIINLADLSYFATQCYETPLKPGFSSAITENKQAIL